MSLQKTGRKEGLDEKISSLYNKYITEYNNSYTQLLNPLNPALCIEINA